jgi:hypothetical protein
VSYATFLCDVAQDAEASAMVFKEALQVVIRFTRGIHHNTCKQIIVKKHSVQHCCDYNHENMKSRNVHHDMITKLSSA